VNLSDSGKGSDVLGVGLKFLLMKFRRHHKRIQSPAKPLDAFVNCHHLQMSKGFRSL
jgi:hypothetical protein